MQEISRTEFLYKSIEDNQNVIRAIDIKLGILLVAAAVPIPILSGFHFPIAKSSLTQFLSFVTLAFWIASVAFAWLGITGIRNPKDHIDLGEQKISGIFFGEALYQFSWYHSFWSTRSVFSKISLPQQLAVLPNDYDCVVKELLYEQMKLIYIRDLKMLRQRWAFVCGALWLILAFLTCICY